MGILNGIDTTIWNPFRDEHLFEPYDVAHPEGKALNKKRLQELLGLEVTERAPLAGCIARLDAQKGFDILLEIAPEMLSEGAQIVLLGSGRREYLHAFEKLKDKFPNALSINEGFREALAADTIVDVDEDPKRGNGFVFEKYHGQAFLDAVRRAKAHFEKSQTWQTLLKRAMRADFSWKNSASGYMEVYEKAVQRRRNL